MSPACSDWPRLSLDEFLKMQASGELLGRVTYITYQHDGWCKTLVEGGGAFACNCDPIVNICLVPKGACNGDRS